MIVVLPWKAVKGSRKIIMACHHTWLSAWGAVRPKRMSCPARPSRVRMSPHQRHALGDLSIKSLNTFLDSHMTVPRLARSRSLGQKRQRPSMTGDALRPRTDWQKRDVDTWTKSVPQWWCENRMVHFASTWAGVGVAERAGFSGTGRGLEKRTLVCPPIAQADKVHRELFNCQEHATLVDSLGETFICVISMELRNDNRVQYTLQVGPGTAGAMKYVLLGCEQYCLVSNPRFCGSLTTGRFCKLVGQARHLRRRPAHLS